MIQRPLTTIRCKECSHALSSRAQKCPLCGCPVEKSVEKNVLPLRWLLVIPAIVTPAVLISIFMVLGRPNNGASNGTQEASSQHGRSQGEGGTHEPTSQGRSESAAGNHEFAPQRQAKNKEVLPGAPAQYEAGSTEVEAIEPFGLGRTHLEKGDYNLAILEFTEAVRRNPNYAAAFTDRGFAYLYKPNYDRAIQDFSQAIRLQPTSDLFANRGLAYFNKGNYDQAIQDYSQAIRLSSHDAELFNDRGVAYSSTGDYDRAIQDYDQAIRLNPNYPAALNNRGWAYSQKGERERAIADYLTALSLKPEDSLRKHVEAALKSLGSPATVVDRH